MGKALYSTFAFDYCIIALSLFFFAIYTSYCIGTLNPPPIIIIPFFCLMYLLAVSSPHPPTSCIIVSNRIY